MGYGAPQQGYGQPGYGQPGYGQPPPQQQRPTSGYQRRQSSGGFVAGSTMGPAGTVDFAALARGAGGGQWSDPDFRPDDSALWIDPQQPGGGAIGGILQQQVWRAADARIPGRALRVTQPRSAAPVLHAC